MTDLFGQSDNGPSTADQSDVDGLIKPTPGLPAVAAAYGGKRTGKKRRAGADPIGVGGLPPTRRELNAKLLELCNRLAAAGGRFAGAKRLVAELDLKDARTLRLLMAYGRVHHRIRELVGVEGVGYCWAAAPAAPPNVYAQAAAIARRKGLCSMFLASLYGKTPAAVQMAQMALEFSGSQESLGCDELDAWMAGENVTPAKLIEAFVDVFAATDEGRSALAAAARKRPGIFLDAAAAEKLRASAMQILDAVGEKVPA